MQVNKRMRIFILFLIVIGLLLLLSWCSTQPPHNCNSLLAGDVHPHIPTVSYHLLLRCRPQVRDTMALINSNGPFPIYGASCDPQCDNRIHYNGRGTLPKRTGQDEGYREYTVITPHAYNRGARRIVTGGTSGRQDSRCYDEVFYSDTHYSTYVYVAMPERLCL